MWIVNLASGKTAYEEKRYGLTVDEMPAENDTIADEAQESVCTSIASCGGSGSSESVKHNTPVSQLDSEA